MALSELLQLKPIYQPRVWGGRRLLPATSQPIGEAWVVYEHNEVASGPLTGRSLASLASEYGSDLLGSEVVRRIGSRFPLLIKLLDAHDWLSVQVHPNDEQARRLEGDDELGKTEAWYILEAAEGARLISGLTGNPSPEALREAATNGTLNRYLNYVEVVAGDVVFTPAGQVHAIGPGLLIYEVQQTSDITYRLFDWNRPASAGRELHLDKGLAVISYDPPAPVRSATDGGNLVTCPYFLLDEVDVTTGRVAMSTGGRSFHALTAIHGDVVVRASGDEVRLNELDSVVVPASVMEYELEPLRSARLLLARAA